MLDVFYRELKIHKPAFRQQSNECDQVSMLSSTAEYVCSYSKYIMNNKYTCFAYVYTYYQLLIIHMFRICLNILPTLNNTNTPVLHMSVKMALFKTINILTLTLVY